MGQKTGGDIREALIIGDIAGEFDALMRLVERVPKNLPIIGVGDLVDRGPHSNEVVFWFMNEARAHAIRGNHEDMFIDYVRGGGKYARGIWLMNGGPATLRSYYEMYPDAVPQNHIDYLSSLPTYRFIDDRKCFISHAPLHSKLSLTEAIGLDPCVDDPRFEASLLWNRTEPKQREFFQVFGHNSHWGLRLFGERDAWGICIDQSRKRVLTGFHWPTGEVIEEPYDKPPTKNP